MADSGESFDFTRFIRDNDAKLRRHVAGLLGARGGELDDVMQLTYLQLWLAAPGIDSDKSARKYCRVVARHIACDNARRSRSHPVDELPADAAGLAPDPADLLLQLELRDILAKAVDSLTPDQRRAWIGYELYGLSYAALASRLSMTPGAVRGLLHRARATLQRNAATVDAALRDGYQSLLLHAVAIRAGVTPAWRGHHEWTAAVIGSAVAVAGLAGPGSPSPEPGPRPPRHLVREARETVREDASPGRPGTPGRRRAIVVLHREVPLEANPPGRPEACAVRMKEACVHYPYAPPPPHRPPASTVRGIAPGPVVNDLLEGLQI